MMDIVRDLLDVQLINPRHRRIGRVDGILLEVRGDAPPRIFALEVGPATSLRRVHGALGWRLRWFMIRWFRTSWRPVRIPLKHFGRVGVDIEIAAGERAERRLLHVERWLSSRIVQRIPGGKRGVKKSS